MTTTLTPLDVAGTPATGITVLSPYAQTQRARTIVHSVVGGGLAFTIIPPDKKSGELQVLVADEPNARYWLQTLALVSRFALAESSDTLVSMTFIVTGDVEIALDSDTLRLRTVTIPYQTV